MHLNEHYNLKNKHAVFNPSSPSWVREDYDIEKILNRYFNSFARTKGDVLHSLAEKMIKYGIKLSMNDRHLVDLYLADSNIPRSCYNTKTILQNLKPYVNDAIDLNMQPEVLLYYSDLFFGTADAIIFEDGLLRIHDLKTGTSPVHIEQLLIYAALFCLEYGILPGEIQFELRIYQNGEIEYCYPTAEEIAPIMDKIIYIDKILSDESKGDIL